jgi:pimeloyl-ACP methyl ester carboxylesterase
VHVPVTLILAGKDEVVGYENGRKLFNDLAGLDLYKFEIADAGHNTIFNYEELYQILSNRLQN